MTLRRFYVRLLYLQVYLSFVALLSYVFCTTKISRLSFVYRRFVFCSEKLLFVFLFGHLFFEFDETFDFVKQSVDVLKLTVHRSVSDVRHFVDVFETFHNHIAERG